MKLHVITGHARSGSTLLCNILNQNPKFYASDTSHIPNTLNVLNNIHSNSPIIKYKANFEPEKTQEKINKMFKSVVESWYDKGEVVFDKSREWSFHARTLAKIYPDAKIICLVRDLRNIFNSIIKQDDKFPLITNEQDVFDSTMRSHFDAHFAKHGLIGRYLNGIGDMIDRALENVLYVKYEDLSTKPMETMKKIYEFIGEEYFDHDFNKVKNVSQEPDGVWNNKFQHKGSGKVVPCNPNEWKAKIPDEFADKIMEIGKLYNKKFEYGKNTVGEKTISN